VSQVSQCPNKTLPSNSPSKILRGMHATTKSSVSTALCANLRPLDSAEQTATEQTATIALARIEARSAVFSGDGPQLKRVEAACPRPPETQRTLANKSSLTSYRGARLPLNCVPSKPCYASQGVLTLAGIRQRRKPGITPSARIRNLKSPSDGMTTTAGALEIDGTVTIGGTLSIEVAGTAIPPVGPQSLLQVRQRCLERFLVLMAPS
jgi:hypothetical protein